MTSNISEILNQVAISKRTLYKKSGNIELHLGFYIDKDNMLPCLILNHNTKKLGFVQLDDTILANFETPEQYQSVEPSIKAFFKQVWPDVKNIGITYNQNPECIQYIAASLNLNMI